MGLSTCLLQALLCAYHITNIFTGLSTPLGYKLFVKGTAHGKAGRPQDVLM